MIYSYEDRRTEKSCNRSNLQRTEILTLIKNGVIVIFIKELSLIKPT